MKIKPLREIEGHPFFPGLRRGYISWKTAPLFVAVPPPKTGPVRHKGRHKKAAWSAALNAT
jgi:hypothetical protein